jgi:hypothetical protein
MSFVDPLLSKMDLSDLSQSERWEALDGHYDRLRKFLSMVAKGKKSLIVNGDAGMGKTEFTGDIIEAYAKRTGKKCGKNSGSLSAVELFVRLHKFRKEGEVFIIDDTDRIFDTVESVEVLKAALDTGKNNEVDWGKAYSAHLGRHKCPTNFTYKGKVIIITNRNIRSAPTQTPTAKQAMLAPLKSRMGYFPAGLPNNEWKIEALRMFASGYQSKKDTKAKPYELRCGKDIKLHKADQLPKTDKNWSVDSRRIVLNEIIDFIQEHQDDLAEISFRTVYQAIGYRNEYPDDWKDMFIVDQYYSD